MVSAVPEPGMSFADQFPDLAAQWHPTKNVSTRGAPDVAHPPQGRGDRLGP